MIRISELRKIYKTEAGDFQALKGINPDINKGEFVGITGIDHPTEGEVVIGGEKIHNLSESDMASW